LKAGTEEIIWSLEGEIRGGGSQVKEVQMDGHVARMGERKSAYKMFGKS